MYVSLCDSKSNQMNRSKCFVERISMSRDMSMSTTVSVSMSLIFCPSESVIMNMIVRIHLNGISSLSISMRGFQLNPSTSKKINVNTIANINEY